MVSVWGGLGLLWNTKPGSLNVVVYTRRQGSAGLTWLPSDLCCKSNASGDAAVLRVHCAGTVFVFGNTPQRQESPARRPRRPLTRSTRTLCPMDRPSPTSAWAPQHRTWSVCKYSSSSSNRNVLKAYNGVATSRLSPPVINQSQPCYRKWRASGSGSAARVTAVSELGAARRRVRGGRSGWCAEREARRVRAEGGTSLPACLEAGHRARPVMAEMAHCHSCNRNTRGCPRSWQPTGDRDSHRQGGGGWQNG